MATTTKTFTETKQLLAINSEIVEKMQTIKYAFEKLEKYMYVFGLLPKELKYEMLDNFSECVEDLMDSNKAMQKLYRNVQREKTTPEAFIKAFDEFTKQELLKFSQKHGI